DVAQNIHAAGPPVVGQGALRNAHVGVGGIELFENRQAGLVALRLGNGIVREWITDIASRIVGIGTAGGGIVDFVGVFRPAQAVCSDLSGPHDSTEVAANFGSCEYAGQLCEGLYGAESFPVSGEPGFVLAIVHVRDRDRPAKIETVLVLPV